MRACVPQRCRLWTRHCVSDMQVGRCFSGAVWACWEAKQATSNKTLLRVDRQARPGMHAHTDGALHCGWLSIVAVRRVR